MTVPRNFYDDVGGAPVFHRIVARFYEEVRDDPVLRPLYPEEDLGPAEDRLRMFLEQYWGGRRTYSDQRGHPRLRMRHMPYTIGEDERDRWLRHMSAAIDAVCADLAVDDRDDVRTALYGHVIPAADHLRNDGLNQFTT